MSVITLPKMWSTQIHKTYPIVKTIKPFIKILFLQAKLAKNISPPIRFFLSKLRCSLISMAFLLALTRPSI